MRKSLSFFLVFIIIVILGAAVFFLGWAQLRVPPGSYGIIRSKTHGIDDRLIHEGEFRWIWYKIIPTNTVITVFAPAIVERPLKISGTLPSGAVYGSFAGIDADFSYEIEGSVSFRVKALSLPVLMRDQDVTDQNALEAFESRIADEVTAFAGELLLRYGEDEKKIQAILQTGTSSQLQTDILEAFPDIEDLVCVIRSVRMPDFALYRTTRSIYEEYLSRQHGLLEQDLAEAAAGHINGRIRYDELSKYGELLSKYPLLLYYLAIERGLDPRSWEIFKGGITANGN
jgi:hypothetical protein